MPLFSRRSRWADVNYLELVPARNYTARRDAQTGRTVILLPRYTGPILGRLLQPRLGPRKRFIQVPLDPRGAFLWDLIDGERTVAALADHFREGFPAERDDVERRVALYLQAMYDNKFIVYVNL